jgi:hypothetical protein
LFTIHNVLQDVDPLPFEITFEKPKSVPLEESDIYRVDPEVRDRMEGLDTTLLEPYDLRIIDIDSPLFETLHARMSMEAKIGGLMKFKNILLVTRLSMGGEAFRRNVFIRYMKHYSSIFNNVEPFVETKDMRPYDIVVDSMAPARFGVLHSAAYIAHTKYPSDRLSRGPGGTVVLSEAWEQLCMFIFKNPWVNTLAIKKATGVVKNCMFMRSKKGDALDWQNVDVPDENKRIILSGFAKRSLSNYPVNDEASFQSTKVGILKDLKGLKEQGNVLLANWFWNMVHGDVTEDNMAQASELVFIETVSGYLRGNPSRSHVEQVLKKPPLGAVPPTYEKFVVDEVAETLRAQQSSIPTEETFLSNLYSRMTTKSSGYKINFSVDYLGKVFKVGSTNKTDVFLSDPEHYLLRETMQQELTEEQPGSVASREVPARAMRAVFMVPLSHYVFEQALGGVFLRHQSKQPYYTLADEVGKSLADHGRGIAASSQENILIKLQDYSQYDSSERFVTARQSVLLGIELGMKALGMGDKEWMHWTSLLDLYKELWGSYEHAVFKSGKYVLTLDQMLSGETFTITINNIINRSNSRVIESEMHERAYETMTKLRWQISFFMGDDSVTFYEVPDPVHLTSVDVDNVKRVASEVTAENSMDLNIDKTSTRLFWYEYLKKVGCYGWVLPRIYQLQIFGSERTNQDMDFQDIMRGYSGLLSEAVSRGHSHPYLIYHMMFFQNLRRRVKYHYKRDDVNKGLVNAPALVNFIPFSLGGAGLMPHTLAGLSKEAVIFAKADNVLRAKMNNIAFIMDFDRRGETRDLVESLESSGVFAKGKSFLKQHLNSGRSVASLTAGEELNKRGISIGKLAYTKTADRLIEASARDNSNFVKMIHESKTLKANRILDRIALFKKMRIESPIIHVWVERDEHATAMELRLYGHGSVACKYSSIQGLPELDLKDIFKVLNDAVNDGGNVLILINAPVETFDYYVHADRIVKGDKSMVFDDIQRVVNILPKASNPIDTYVHNEFKWLIPFKFEYGEELAQDRIPLAPVAGVSEDMKVLMKTYGVSGSGDEFSFRIMRTITKLIADPSFPNDIRVETIFDTITKPSIIEDPTNIILVLVTMGADSQAASAVATEIHRLARDFTSVRRTSSYSTADQVIGILDLSYQTYKEVVNDRLEDFLVISPSTIRALRSVGLIMSIVDAPYDSNMNVVARRRVNIRVDRSLLHLFEEATYPEFMTPVMDYSSIGHYGLVF